MHDALVGGDVDGSRQHLWIDFMKTVIFLESVADPSILLPGSADVVGGYLRFVLRKSIMSEDRIALCVSGGADK